MRSSGNTINGLEHDSRRRKCVRVVGSKWLVFSSRKVELGEDAYPKKTFAGVSKLARALRKERTTPRLRKEHESLEFDYNLVFNPPK